MGYMPPEPGFYLSKTLNLRQFNEYQVGQEDISLANHWSDDIEDIWDTHAKGLGRFSFGIVVLLSFVTVFLFVY
jgi:hypothetical protein